MTRCEDLGSLPVSQLLAMGSVLILAFGYAMQELSLLCHHDQVACA